MKIDYPTFFERFERFCKDHLPPGRTFDARQEMHRFCPVLGWGVDFDWQIGWGIRTQLHVNPKRKFIEINWSMTSHSPSSAIAATVLHRRVAEFACLLEAWMAQFDLSEWEECPPDDAWKGRAMVFVEKISVGVS